jgi:hypothetical protein
MIFLGESKIHDVSPKVGVRQTKPSRGNGAPSSKASAIPLPLEWSRQGEAAPTMDV